MNFTHWGNISQNSPANTQLDWDDFSGRHFPTAIVPIVSTSETETSYRIEWLVFGLEKEELFVKVEKPLLTVIAQRYSDPAAIYSQSYIPPANANWDDISVRISEGCIQVVIQKRPV